MTIHAPDLFGKFPTTAAPFLRTATRSELAVLGWITLHAGNVSHVLKRSIAAIARAVGLHVATVRRAVRRWVERGVIILADGRRHNSVRQMELQFEQASPRPESSGSVIGAPARGHTRLPDASCSRDQAESCSRLSVPVIERSDGTIDLKAMVAEAKRRAADGAKQRQDSARTPTGHQGRTEAGTVSVSPCGRWTPLEAATMLDAAKRIEGASALRDAGVSPNRAWMLSIFGISRIREVISRCRSARPDNPGGWIASALIGRWRWGT